MDRNELATALFSAAERRAQGHGRRMGHGADGDIRQFAYTAADRLLSMEPSIEPSHPLFRKSEVAFEMLIDEMVSSAAQIPGYREIHPQIIGEKTLARALARLCPLFPIC